MKTILRLSIHLNWRDRVAAVLAIIVYYELGWKWLAVAVAGTLLLTWVRTWIKVWEIDITGRGKLFHLQREKITKLEVPNYKASIVDIEPSPPTDNDLDDIVWEDPPKSAKGSRKY